MKNREKLLEQLTGVNSSKLNYYVELKKSTEETLKQNSRLEILHQLTRDINIDMSIQDIINRTFNKLPQALPCTFLGLVTIRDGELSLKAVAPQDYCRVEKFPADSPAWEVIRSKKASIFNIDETSHSHVWHNPKYPNRLTSFAIAPMFERTEVIGVLVIGRSVEAPFYEAELKFVNHLADQMAISIQNARLYKQVSRTTKEWEETFKAVTDPIFLVDLNHNILRHNDRLTPDISPYWPESNERKCFARLYGRDKPCKNCPIEEIKKKGKPVQRKWQTSTGRLIETFYYPVFNDDNQLSAVTILLKDVTRKTKMEAQLVHSAKLAALGEMAAGVAHELNSPMTVIIGTAQMLLRDSGRDELDAESLQDIINCGLRCKRIIQNLLTFSRQDQAPMTATDLNEEARRVLGLIRYQINRNQILIADRLAPDLPPVNANAPQIQQVLTNLLINARDALDGAAREDRSITVSSFSRQKEGKRWAVISVQDNGIGIAKENLQRIFTPFFTSKEASKGTGLGLSVSLGIAESHEGTIEVNSRLGQGSTFSLVLPAAEGSDNDTTHR
ncbi:MAG: GAF domain-containing protein [Desulfuromonadales bacterium]|nr:GAF domain-containing protein [Desulfuromonadales bacterium]NIR33533.1 GAF domain-containing protein [Desulfuromonadales bacterium]NIS43547.1 GAF domain-containing protein [Desulfuromonadales bacterium]